MKNNNRAENPPGCVLSDIKRRSLSSLLDRIPRKKEPCYSCLSGRAQDAGKGDGKHGVPGHEMQL